MRRRPQYLVLLGALIVCGLVAATFVVRTESQRASATENAERFARQTPQVVASQRPVVVSVIGDDLASPAQSGTPVTEWPALVQRDIGGRVVSLSTAGSGYTTRPLTSLYGGTFAARAQQVAPTSRVVLIVGGGNDQRASSVQLLRAASTTISHAQKAAPDAKVVVVGPVSDGDQPSTTLLSVRDDLRDAARRGDARFVDPIVQGWLKDGSGYFAADERSLTAKGERELARRIEGVLRTAL